MAERLRTLGDAARMREVGADLGRLADAAEKRRLDQAAGMFLEVDGRARSLIDAADPIKDGAAVAGRALHTARPN
jgi:cation transport ATPase